MNFVSYKLYTLDNQFIEESIYVPDNFTGISRWSYGECWYLNGKWHRLDGPARKFYNKFKEWHLNGKQVSEEQHKLYRDLMNLKGLA